MFQNVGGIHDNTGIGRPRDLSNRRGARLDFNGGIEREVGNGRGARAIVIARDVTNGHGARAIVIGRDLSNGRGTRVDFNGDIVRDVSDGNEAREDRKDLRNGRGAISDVTFDRSGWAGGWDRSDFES